MKKSLLIAIIVIVVIGGVFLIVSHDRNTVVAPVTDTTTTGQTSPAGTTSSASGATAKNVIQAPTQETLFVGQGGTLGNVAIKLNSIKQDSRCPVGVNCIQAGSVTVNATVTKDKVTVTHDFLTTAAAFEFQGYNISVISVTPSPIAGQGAIKSVDYHVTFQAVPTTKANKL